MYGPGGTLHRSVHLSFPGPSVLPWGVRGTYPVERGRRGDRDELGGEMAVQRQSPPPLLARP